MLRMAMDFYEQITNILLYLSKTIEIIKMLSLPKTLLLCITALSSFINIADAAANLTAKSCHSASSQAPTKYPNKCKIATIFESLVQSNFPAFLSHVSSNVTWTLMGTHPLAGEYTNRDIFAEDALQRLANTLDMSKPVSLTPIRIIGGGDEEWSTIELHGLGTGKNGKFP
jgi:ketosteroid isomerase-like protein